MVCWVPLVCAVDVFSMGLPPLDLNGFTNLSVVRSKLSEGTIDVLVVIVVAVVVAVVLLVDVCVSAVVKMVVDLVVVDVVVVVVFVVVVVVVVLVMSLVVVDSEMKMGLNGLGLLLNLLLLLPPSALSGIRLLTLE